MGVTLHVLGLVLFPRILRTLLFTCRHFLFFRSRIAIDIQWQEAKTQS